jgi:putative acetyltransferase
MGVASALLELLVADAGVRGIHNLYTEASRTARPFFEQAGFSLVRTHSVTRNGVAFEQFVMERKPH